MLSGRLFRWRLLCGLLLRLFRGLFGNVHGIIAGELDTSRNDRCLLSSLVGSAERVEHIEGVLLVLVLTVRSDRFLLMCALLCAFVCAVRLHDCLVVLLLPLLQVFLGERGHGDRLPAAELGEREEEEVRGLLR